MALRKTLMSNQLSANRTDGVDLLAVYAVSEASVMLIDKEVTEYTRRYWTESRTSDSDCDAITCVQCVACVSLHFLVIVHFSV